MSLLALTTLGLSSICACQRPTATIPSHPQRIVSLRPNLTELLFALGAGNRVVGVTDYCVWPDEAKNLPKIGSYLFPDLEKIMALQPDLVVTNKESSTARFVEKLQETGIPVMILETRHVEDIYRTIATFGELLDLQQSATALQQSIKSAFLKVRNATKDQKPKTALIVIQRRPLIIAGRNSYFNEILEAAGAWNAAADLKVPYPQISMEEVIAWQPDVILDIDPNSSEASWTGYSNIPAVRNEQIYLLSPNLFRPGPRIGQAAEMIAHALYVLMFQTELPSSIPIS